MATSKILSMKTQLSKNFCRLLGKMQSSLISGGGSRNIEYSRLDKNAAGKRVKKCRKLARKHKSDFSNNEMRCLS